MAVCKTDKDKFLYHFNSETVFPYSHFNMYYINCVCQCSSKNSILKETILLLLPKNTLQHKIKHKNPHSEVAVYCASRLIVTYAQCILHKRCTQLQKRLVWVKWILNQNTHQSTRRQDQTWIFHSIKTCVNILADDYLRCVCTGNYYKKE